MFTPEDLVSVTAPLAHATTLPPHYYIEPEVFERERRLIFEREWVCVARTDQVPNAGDYVCTDVVDQPLIVSRQLDGRIHAMSAVCLHRAMPVCTGSGNTTSFSCPYHLWKYSLDGQLVSAPMMDDVEGFDVAACKLPEVRCETWQGFVFVNLDRNAEPLSPRLARLDKMLVNYGLSYLVVANTIEFDSPWNWKLLVENFMEAYHHIGPHNQTLQPLFPARQSYVVGDEEHLWSALHMPGHADRDHADEPRLPYFPGINDTQKHHLIACVVSPTLLFAIGGSTVYWYQLFPKAHDRMDLKIHILLRKETLSNPQLKDAIDTTVEIARYVHLEDIAVNEGPWRGLHAPLAREGRLSMLEEAIWHLNQFWAERVVEHVD